MYLGHFKLKTNPFAMTPDPAFLYESKQHSTAMTRLEYAIESQAWFCLLTGEIGSGKTTLIRRLLRTLGEGVTVGLVSNTHRRFQSVHPWALSALGIGKHASSEIDQYETLTEFMIGEYSRGRRTLLIFDEAQNLSVQTLEELRLLSNINSEGDVVLQTILIGQPELRLQMAKPELQQFAQRVAVDFHLNALSVAESMAYVRHRLAVAGRYEPIFNPSAIELIHAESGGIPRLINQLCDLSLIYAFADGLQQVSAALVSKAVEDRDSGKGISPHAFSGGTIAALADINSAPPLPMNDGSMPERV